MELIKDRIFDDFFNKKDESYREFHKKLIPNVDEKTIIGVRVPDIRNITKKYKDSKSRYEFMKDLPHDYYEANLLHSLFINDEKDLLKVIELLNDFLPFVNNWAVCDALRPNVVRENLEKFFEYIKIWINSEHEYTVRFAIEMLMVYYLDDYFEQKYLDIVVNVKSDFYYVKMMQAWYIATALCKQSNFALEALQEKKLDRWVHNKSIQKAVESYRVTDELKKEVKKLKLILE